ncbi:hypothetical protein HKX48_005117 [Thoreauomyces humboldtii]|nr:hypothetical protein HKX48_005117 [Thoreauomyces humboldtii]
MSQHPQLSPPKDSKENLDREVDAFAEHIRNLFADNSEHLTPKYLPISRDNFFSNLQDGVLLAHVINAVKGNTVNISKLNLHVDTSLLSATASNDKNSPEQTKAVLEATNNLNICMEAAKGVAHIVNLGAQDFLAKKPDLVLGVMWQLIRAHLLSDINVPSHPELIRLLEPGESLTHLISLTNEGVLLRWFNYHLSRAGTDRRVQNFGKDVADGEAYILLLKQVLPWSKRSVSDDLAEIATIPVEDREARARGILSAAEKLGVRKFVTVSDIVGGQARLNLAFVATVFSKYIAIHLPTEDEARAATIRSERLEADNATYRAKIIELEKSVLSLSRDLDTQRQLYETTVTTFESKVSAETTSFQRSIDDLRMEKQHESEEYAEKLHDLSARFAALKDDQATATSTQQAIRTLVGDKLGAVRSTLRDHVIAVRAQGNLAAKLGKLLGGIPAPAGTIEATPVAPIREASSLEQELDFLSSDLQDFVKEILDENRENKNVIHILAERAAQNEKINSLLGDKIKLYTEHQIALNPVKEKKQERPKEFVKLKS